MNRFYRATPYYGGISYGPMSPHVSIVKYPLSIILVMCECNWSSRGMKHSTCTALRRRLCKLPPSIRSHASPRSAVLGSSNGVSSQRSRYVTQTSVVCRPNIRAPFHAVDYKPPIFLAQGLFVHFMLYRMQCILVAT